MAKEASNGANHVGTNPPPEPSPLGKAKFFQANIRILVTGFFFWSSQMLVQLVGFWSSQMLVQLVGFLICFVVVVVTKGNTIAAFARMTVEDSRKLFSPKYYPSWVVFSQRQKLTWLNLELEKIWTYVNEAASELVKANVEPVLEQYRPVMLASLTFSKFTSGTVAPHRLSPGRQAHGKREK